jgi:hypothetical protein
MTKSRKIFFSGSGRRQGVSSGIDATRHPDHHRGVVFTDNGVVDAFVLPDCDYMRIIHGHRNQQS